MIRFFSVIPFGVNSDFCGLSRIVGRNDRLFVRNGSKNLIIEREILNLKI
ncbi:Uncharacterized protein dnm_090080 [Desulfonema magnum]|uniref:Uncharacterized protein n=1 Tax=Desulfonema magnum TaxID=45655 RepID=A0A975BW65_9BACT|nr:Uncharacterized protein dnm_090080 [Desulfonema magnum]